MFRVLGILLRQGIPQTKRDSLSACKMRPQRKKSNYSNRDLFCMESIEGLFNILGGEG